MPQEHDLIPRDWLVLTGYVLTLRDTGTQWQMPANPRHALAVQLQNPGSKLEPVYVIRKPLQSRGPLCEP